MPECLRCNRMFGDEDGLVLTLVTDSRHNFMSTSKICLVDWYHRTGDERGYRVLSTDECGSCGLCNDCILNKEPTE